MFEADPLPLRDYLTRLRDKLARPEAVAVPARSAGKKVAAVLVPLMTRAEGLHVLYTRRSDRLSSHRGQVAFPGGRFDPRDPHLLAAALRETHEEVGIAPDSVEVLGSFEGRETRASEIFVTPFVGIVRGPVAMRPDPKEVAEIFEVPLAALSDRRYRGEYKWSNNGSTSYHPAILYGGQTIWGLTYYLTLRFLELSRAASARSTKR
jgi:8-oxo-dGTP pyrophosphatase MutT (NUDIX family)